MPQSPVQIELNADEETILQAGLIQTLTKVAQFFKFPPTVIWTAANYLKRFYLLNSVYDHDPMQMMFTALFLATKAEEVNVSLRVICEGVKICEEKRVRTYEIHLLRGIKYHLHVFNPYRPLETLWREASERIDTAERDNIRVKTLKSIEGMLLTDWVFLESPAVLAVSALILAVRSRIDLEEWVQGLLSTCEIDRNVGQLIATADLIRTEVERVAVLTTGSEQQFRSATKKVQGVHKRLARGSTEASNSGS